MFSLLEHADESGAMQGAPAAARGNQARQQQGNRGTQPRRGNQAQAAAAASQSSQSNARAEDYYRAFEHVYIDQSSGVSEVVLRFHKTKIVRIRPNGDFMLSSGGWHTATTVAALNDALQALGMRVTYTAPVSAGVWVVTDDTGQQLPFKDNMVIKATKAEHKQRGMRLLKAYNGGADVPRYTRKPAAGGAAPAGAAARPPQQPAAARPAAPAQPRAAQPQQQQQQHAGPKPADGQALEQLMAAMNQLAMDDDTFVCGDDHLCIACLHRPRNIVLIPCGHMVLCEECCADIKAKTNLCPMCRENIEDHCTIDPDDA